MSESQWWLYDLVVLAVAVLCIWNGISGGIVRAVGGVVMSIISCLLASLIASPVAEMAYDAFFQERCQNMICEKLAQMDVTENIRDYLGQKGIYLPYSDAELAQMFDEIRVDDAQADQAAALLGMDADQLREQLMSAVTDAVNAQEGLIPDWAEKTITEADLNVSGVLNTAADAAAALFSNDYRAAAVNLEKTYIRPAAISLLSVLVFAVSAFFISLLLRMFLIVLPERSPSLGNQLMGGLLGLVKTGIYLYLIVLLVSCIVSMQDGAYSFFYEETINRTYIFRLLYDAFVR